MEDFVLNILESYLKWEKKKIEINYDSLSQDRGIGKGRSTLCRYNNIILDAISQIA